MTVEQRGIAPGWRAQSEDSGRESRGPEHTGQVKNEQPREHPGQRCRHNGGEIGKSCDPGARLGLCDERIRQRNGWNSGQREAGSFVGVQVIFVLGQVAGDQPALEAHRLIDAERTLLDDGADQRVAAVLIPSATLIEVRIRSTQAEPKRRGDEPSLAA